MELKSIVRGVLVIGMGSLGMTEAAVASEAVKVSGLLQVWGVTENTAANAQSANGGSDQRHGALIRRAEVAVTSADMEHGVEWGVMFDPSKGISNSTGDAFASDAKILQDAFVGYKFGENAKLRFGQMLLRITQEGTHPAGDLVFAERSFVGRFGDVRDVGGQFIGKSSNFHYTIGVFNGNGSNGAANEEIRRLASSVAYDMSDTTQVGAWTDYTGQGLTAAESQSSGAYVRWKSSTWLFQTEVAKSWTGDEELGAYGVGQYRLSGENFVAARVDYMKDNPTGNTQLGVDLGYEVGLGAGKKLQFNYRTGSEKSSGESETIQQFVMNFQAAF